MTVRCVMLQAHYRSTLDFSNESLDASEKGFRRLMAAAALLHRLPSGNNSTTDVTALEARCYAAMNDDFNRSEEHTSELQSLMRISYAVFCLKNKKAMKTLLNTATLQLDTHTQ